MTERSQLRRLPNRGSNALEAVYAILDSASLAHVGFVVDGQPYVIPTLFGRAGDHLYLHGSAASRMMHALETGVPVCVAVTQVDGLVLARSAFHHSMNYRSAIVFGTARKIDDPEQKTAALKIISDHLIVGRWEEVRPPSNQELKATTVLAIAIEEASAKSRSGAPADDEADYALPIWAGVLPLTKAAGVPEPDSRLDSSIPVSPSIFRFKQASKIEAR
jgi:nitroimidazol reductase NimA-like FMN-containing flavoprotein (pyridoxamine 5'-phosphate oxidase superfamily)